MSHLKAHKMKMILIPSQRKTGREFFQAPVPHNKDISVIPLLLLPFGSSQKLFHIFDIDTRR
jgi:hypothetical protein